MRFYLSPKTSLIKNDLIYTGFEINWWDTFICNYKRLTKEDVQKLVYNSILFSKYNQVMHKFLMQFLKDTKAHKYVICQFLQREMHNSKHCINTPYLQD